MAAPGTKDAAPAATDGKHLYLSWHSFLQTLYVGDDTDQFPPLLQAGQGTQRCVQRIFIQRTETFIKEEGIDPGSTAGHLGEPQGQGQADKKAFASREVFCAAQLSGLVVITDIELQRPAAHLQHIAVSHFDQLPIGMGDHQLKVHLLDDVTEFFPVSGPYQFLQRGPLLEHAFLLFHALYQYALFLMQTLIVRQPLQACSLFLLLCCLLLIQRSQCLFQFFLVLCRQGPGSLGGQMLPGRSAPPRQLHAGFVQFL